LIPASLSAYFTYIFAAVSKSGPFSVTAEWAPALNLSLSFRFDGLSTFFAILIAAVGTLIVVYAAKYFEHHPHAGRFNAALFAFMGSMLGLVLSDNVIALFVFWELTGFTSYLLIGFEHERPEARRAATQALLVTGGGGLALLAAAILMLQAGGTAQLSELAARGSLAAAPTYAGMVALLLLAAFTKSAQFPFHFWLPNAMQAPTPVSAYLHSATMVKAGVYLVADCRRDDALDGDDHDRRRSHDDRRRRPSDHRDGSQAHPRVLNRQRARCLDAAVCGWHTAGCCCRSDLPPRTCLL
jgi:multicomponent Na+:H+ antiporter subunit A